MFKFILRIFPIRHRILLFFLLLAGGAVLAGSAREAGADGNIRVLIARKSGPLTIQGQELALRDLRTGRLLFKNQRSNSLTLKREKGYLLLVGPEKVAARAFIMTAGGGVLTVSGRRYHNRLKMFPGPDGDIRIVNDLPMEDYLVGVVNAEVFSHWPMEAMKAQAVIARTYATHQKWKRAGEPYDLDSTVADQVYAGMDKEDDRGLQATRQTAGELLLYGGNPIFSVYHACCGGSTDSAQNQWPGDHPYLKRTPCNSCLDSPHFLWNYRITKETLAKSLARVGLWGSQILEVDILERSESKRVVQVGIQSDRERMKISGKEFRRILGYDLLRSTHFVVKEENGGFLFSGLGWGHGTGLCQWGARGMAEAGQTYRSILNYYYQDVDLGKWPR